MMARKTYTKTYNTIYFSGILSGISVVTGTIFDYEKWHYYSGKPLLIGSIIFIVILYLIGFTAIKVGKELVIGSKIQTAGYLYTLIGFIVAILQLNDQSRTIDDIIYPIGTALVTSLLGWFLGGLINEARDRLSEASIEAEAEAVSIELENFAHKIKVVHESFEANINDIHNKYVNTLSATIDEFKGIQDKAGSFANSFDKLEDSIGKLADTNLATSVEKLSSEFGTLLSHMINVSERAKDTAEYLDTTKLLVDKVQEFIESRFKDSA